MQGGEKIGGKERPPSYIIMQCGAIFRDDNGMESGYDAGLDLCEVERV